MKKGSEPGSRGTHLVQWKNRRGELRVLCPTTVGFRGTDSCERRQRAIMFDYTPSGGLGREALNSQWTRKTALMQSIKNVAATRQSHAWDIVLGRCLFPQESLGLVVNVLGHVGF
ncbi:unnamed protein product [Aspergillus oryzae var. brunneus]|uniref:Unnamed protein product n=2 Tax=Aspergillus oryzae TaxID=5062 RepID=A0AAN5BXP8_ASPOZ|nr:unnamed protein product [Aspergillus oryzae]GMG17505.1 unnamed protein product [Aspergillus oryzae]GMG30890.1 unnamed protein product [Aspergillus oryzae]GMG50863.1 unnamed protein product [Aspergillus oryzae var. brunneus]